MLNNAHQLDLTAQDIELIEAALQTQKKILSVQSQAGGSGADRKLTDINHLMKRINRSTQSKDPLGAQGWGCFARSLFGQECSSPR
ncbi:hypothetical protein [uncultured Roseobacter sp.]|uniref:hypothetical protein n=1 Tax=uncultured Roseobacter sp. TaxID=114847 RepID=UPI00260AFB4F|nr:hypothetical protein [uncultured Roseobacter sp.]